MTKNYKQQTTNNKNEIASLGGHGFAAPGPIRILEKRLRLRRNKLLKIITKVKRSRGSLLRKTVAGGDIYSNKIIIERLES